MAKVKCGDTHSEEDVISWLKQVHRRSSNAMEVGRRSGRLRDVRVGMSQAEMM
jgi:hypothetical protein